MDTSIADINHTINSSYYEAPYDLLSFDTARSLIQKQSVAENVPFSNAKLVSKQVQLLNARLEHISKQKVFRLIVRNIFLTLGVPSRLKNAGDNYAFTELAVSFNNNIALFEIEAGSDILDSLRRIISGIAVANSRYQVAMEKLIPCVVITNLPNARVDYYETIENAQSRLNIEVRTLPISILLLGLRGSSDILFEYIKNLNILDSKSPTMVESVKRTWGEVSDAGIFPAKLVNG
jgi:hypothetical protein